MQGFRPRFELVVPFPPAEVFARLDRQLACPGCPCRALVVRRTIGGAQRRSTIEVEIVEERRHVWSPRLTLEVADHPDGARLFGLFGPNPTVWTGVVACYAFLGLGALFGLMLGLAQLSVGLRAWGLWVPAAAALLGALPYAASQVGQARAADQMQLLRCFLDAALGIAEAPPPPDRCPVV
ncbi:MAG: hypothetical protein KF878_30070 [Planctomycetes bacterium]|nr:hypothetical protein [Planctomycetota bacterium]